MLKPLTGIANECRKVELLRIIEESAKDARFIESDALMWARIFIKQYTFKMGHGMEPTADLLKQFGMFIVEQYREIEL